MSVLQIVLPEGHWPGFAEQNPGLAPPNGWAGSRSIPNKVNFDYHERLYADIVEWILANVERPRSNAHWRKVGDCLYFQIRKPKDFIAFLLRWGHE